MLPINNEDEGAIFLLTGSSSAIDNLVSRKESACWDEATRQVRVNMTDLYSAGDKRVQESSRLHVVELSTDDDREAAGDKEESGALWGKIVSEINYISSLNAVMYDFKDIDDRIRAQYSKVTLRQAPPGSSAGSGGVQLGSIELLNAPCIEDYVPSEDAVSISKYLCEWPVLVLAAFNEDAEGKESGGGCSSYVLPLDPCHDVIPLIKGFRRELDRFLKASAENHSDFSLFSAFHALQLLTTGSSEPSEDGEQENAEPPGEPFGPWIPHVFKTAAAAAALGEASDEHLPRRNSLVQSGDPTAADDQTSLGELLGQEILTDPFCCYQILRCVCLTVKSGFAELIGDQDPAASVPYYQVLFDLQKQLRNISICRQMGLRLSYSSTKYAALLMYGLTQKTEHRFCHADLIRLSQYERLECDVGTCFPCETNKLLPIQKLSAFVKNAVDQTPILHSDVPNTELGNAFERLRQIGVATSKADSIWLRFNTDVFFMSSIAHQTMKGEISRKSLSTIWSVPGGEQQYSNLQWIALFCAGFAFTLALPASLFEFINEDGQLTCVDVREIFQNGGEEMETFIVYLDYKELPWQDVTERLKELYRLKNSWTKLELSAWLDRCLLQDSDNIESIIQRCLRAGAHDGVCQTYENCSLQLEL